MNALRDAILDFGSQLKKGAECAPAGIIGRQRIIYCGMGGSSVAGEMLSIARENVVVHWDWDLPTGQAGANDFVVCTSWSGNTAETISSYDAARAAGIPLAVITTGPSEHSGRASGALAQKAKNDVLPLALLPASSTPPRFNAGLMTGAMFALAGIADRLPVVNSATHEIAGEKLAGDLGAKIPIFYAGYPWRKIAGFFKTSINENAKRHSWTASVPSSAHNEIMGWASKQQENFIPVFVRDSDERTRDRADIEAFIAILGRIGYTVATIDLVGATPLEKALNAYSTAMWTSWHVATAAGVDSASTELIDELKRLKSK